MSNQKTKHEWRVVEHGLGGKKSYLVTDDAGEPVGWIALPYIPIVRAAPKLLAALKDARALVSRLPQSERTEGMYRPDGTHCTIHEAIRAIDAAILQAEGRL